MTMSVRLFLSTIIAALFLSAVSSAQQKSSPYTISIKGNEVLPLPNAQQWFDSVLNQRNRLSQQVVLQFHQVPTMAQRRALAATGILLMEYIPNFCYTAFLPSTLRNLNTSELGIRSVMPLLPEWKVDERVQALSKTGSPIKMRLLVSFVKQTSEIEIAATLKQYDAVITDNRFSTVNTFEIRLPGSQLDLLAKNSLVKYVGLPADIQPLNIDARSSSGASLLHSPLAPGGSNLDGSGVTVGVGDNASAIYHVDARDRVRNFNPSEAMMHGIHTTVTVGGKGIMDPRTLGMAPSASLINHIYDLVWAQTPYMFTDYNMTITNNSYAAVLGDPVYAGTYDQYAQMLDEYQRSYPFVQHVFASGNDGLLQYGSFPPGYGTVTGGYQPSKNILTVGAMTKYDTLWPKTSRGPVKDGRLKPEIMGYGFSIYSGNVFDMYGHSNGTSMSSPVVAGNLALLQQRYNQLSGNQNIPSDLLKALAMNGATDMGKPGPDFTHGFGLINTYRSVQMLNNNRYLIDSVNNAQIKNHTIVIPPNTAQVKIMLYWHDAPASPLSSSALVNNLDLEASMNSAAYLPWILDPAPGNVANNAVRGVDNRNNVEQITIDNPTAGNCSITVKGSLLPTGKQRYVLVYDFIPVGIKIKFPVAGSNMPASDSLHIYWDASNDPSGFTVEYSDNNGASWNILDNNIPSFQRYFYWRTPNISSSQCSLRVKRNNGLQQDQSGSFTINPEPKVLLAQDQCPGYVNITWNGITNVTGYQILRKSGDDLVPVDTVSNTDYSFSGLPFTELQYVAVRPLVNGVPGWRSKAVNRLPGDGTCNGSFSDGDLAAGAVLSPASGRKFTSTALSTNEMLSVQVHNLDDAVAANYRVSFSINNSPWQSQIVSQPIAARGSTQVNFPGQNFSATGVYKIQFAVENLQMADPQKINDSFTAFVRQLDNAPVSINTTFTEDFESLSAITVRKDSVGLLPGDHWDFENSTDSGRLRSFVSSDVLIEGNRSLSLDLFVNKPDNQNYLTGTFNLQAYNAAVTEGRVEFDYKLHGKPKFLSGNGVWVRGSDTASWVLLYQFDTSVIHGTITNTGSLSLSNALVQNGQNFSSSFQVRIGQRDTSLIAMNEYGNGLTLDNFKLYSVKNDVQLVSVISPAKFNCGIESTWLTVQVYNSDNLPQDTIELFYSLDNGPIQKDTIFYLGPKDTVTHTFKTQLVANTLGNHKLNIWLRAEGDSYLPNDSILNYNFRNQPSITSFPYLENFEMGDGDWFAEGQNNSWQYGTPNSQRLNKAASGTKIWTTNLTGNYNDNEESYLYSPCFEIAGLDNPMLSFSLSTHVENCGSTLCDAAFVEYSEDGIIWKKLGNNGEGTNWYGNLQVWNDTTIRWRVASIALPKNIPSLKLRFVMKSDAAAAWNGIGIDDIHIFDLKHSIYEGPSTKVTNTAIAGGWIDFNSGDELLAQIQSPADLGTTEVLLYDHPSLIHPILNQYRLSRSFVVNNSASIGDSVLLRLFITDAEVTRLISDRQCDTCPKAQDAYRLGITKYDDEDKARENGSLSDNLNGNYSFIPHTQIQWVPYDNGYYAQVKLLSFSEFWFNTGLPGKVQGTMLLYPNPVTEGKVHIAWNGEPGSELTLQLYDAAGKKVYEATAKSTDYDNKTTFEIPSLETGIYTARCVTKKENLIYKLLIVK